MDNKIYNSLVAEETAIMDATENICERMLMLGVSRETLADRIGISVRRLRTLLSGKKDMTIRQYARIMYALGYEEAKLLTDIHQ